MNDIVTLAHQNVCKDGFTVTDTVDAGNSFLAGGGSGNQRSISLVFLDLPAPWDAVDHAKKTLRVRMLINPSGSLPTCVFRKTALRVSAASVHAWNKFYEQSVL
jgi:tRNA A58 N-methylase Trm61